MKKAARVFRWENMDPRKTETSSRNSVSGNFVQLEGGQHKVGGTSLERLKPFTWWEISFFSESLFWGPALKMVSKYIHSVWKCLTLESVCGQSLMGNPSSRVKLPTLAPTTLSVTPRSNFREIDFGEVLDGRFYSKQPVAIHKAHTGWPNYL